MEAVAHLLGSGGMLPDYSQSDGPGERSAKFKGVRQGMMLFMIGVLLVPIMGVFSAFTGGGLSEGFAMLAALFALLCFAGGLVRMLFAALFEEGAGARGLPRAPYVPASNAMPAPSRMNVLPPAAANPVGGWRRPNTAELMDRPSVTENTTRLLGRDTDQDQDR
jgi:hypothetical protein